MPLAMHAKGFAWLEPTGQQSQQMGIRQHAYITIHAS